MNWENFSNLNGENKLSKKRRRSSCRPLSTIRVSKRNTNLILSLPKMILVSGRAASVSRMKSAELKDKTH